MFWFLRWKTKNKEDNVHLSHLVSLCLTLLRERFSVFYVASLALLFFSFLKSYCHYCNIFFIGQKKNTPKEKKSSTFIILWRLPNKKLVVCKCIDGAVFMFTSGAFQGAAERRQCLPGSHPFVPVVRKQAEADPLHLTVPLQLMCLTLWLGFFCWPHPLMMHAEPERLCLWVNCILIFFSVMRHWF